MSLAFFSSIPPSLLVIVFFFQLSQMLFRGMVQHWQANILDFYKCILIETYYHVVYVSQLTYYRKQLLKSYSVLVMSLDVHIMEVLIIRGGR